MSIGHGQLTPAFNPQSNQALPATVHGLCECDLQTNRTLNLLLCIYALKQNLNSLHILKSEPDFSTLLELKCTARCGGVCASAQTQLIQNLFSQENLTLH